MTTAEAYIRTSELLAAEVAHARETVNTIEQLTAELKHSLRGGLANAYEHRIAEKILEACQEWRTKKAR